MDATALTRSRLIECILLLYLGCCLGLRNCTGPCPTVQNCIMAIMRSGDCCPSCVQRGCTCEGYQYYDCTHAGFRDGKVPVGEKYSVDFGSTECVCQDDGLITCHYMPCQELPPNCIEVAQPADGCEKCLRLGCVHGHRKYEAGQSFKTDPCQMCQCPNEGGLLKCSPISDCNPTVGKRWYTANQADTFIPPTTSISPPDNHIRQQLGEKQGTIASLPADQSASGRPETTQPGGRGQTEHEDVPTSRIDNTRHASHFHVAEDQLPPMKQPFQTLFSSKTDETKETRHQRASVMFDVQKTCEEGQKWASIHKHCNIPSPAEYTPFKREVGRLCCMASWRGSECTAGVNASMDGCDCEAAYYGADTYKECCSCCSLALNLRRRGLSCITPPVYPADQCMNAFQQCCQADLNGISPHHDEKRCRPNIPPGRVSDCPYPTDALTLGEGEESDNDVVATEEAQDINECQMYEGLCHHMCINTPGSYQCTCRPGYVLQQDGSVCMPGSSSEVNKLNEDRPMPNSTLEPTNPCEGNWLCMHHCSVVAGQAKCSCLPGFALLEDHHSCEDIDECAQGTHKCGATFKCLNTPGSFSCQALMPCTNGFTLDSQGQCVDIDECNIVAQPCSLGFNCINTVGSYTCQRKVLVCSRGYHTSTDGSRCIDVDECQTSVHQCGQGQTCHNLPGSYRCECQTGYHYDMFRRTCVDVNECWRYLGRLCAQTCENTPGSYQCTCNTGFSLSRDGMNCEDVNECNSNPCSHKCVNMYGSYQCYCMQGYQLMEDKHMCNDIDECSQGIGHLCTYKCVNSPGSYQCGCPEHGFSVSPNGRSCQDIDECALGSHNCSREETCFNIHGGFRCLLFSCPENYRRISDIRCDRISCPNFVDCQTTPLRITYYQLKLQTNTIIPAQVFRIGPSPAYTGDNVIVSITKGNEENFFMTRKLNTYTGALYLLRQVQEPKDFLIDVEMKLWRQGMFNTFLARIYVFITAQSF
ncbi:fibulin-2-like isoform X2 [Denticeps clupeoides]|uniref:fibulin-2-like isoform X2 n=1 Tax=Denticeps clupeoides TaxID=299321 RepID=UPI0010A469DB|nr:fibulin-2-like isoform X2 [Denticeps clupeoides]